jgi:AcrR family transcriptional regulator
VKASGKRRTASARTVGRGVSRSAVLAAAGRLIAARGVEALTLREVALALDVTPATVVWHVRSKEQLLHQLVEAAFHGWTPPVLQGTWQRRVRRLSTWFRAQLLAQRELVRTPAFWDVLPYAFAAVGFAARDVLRDAGLSGAPLALASRTVYWHTISFVLMETLVAGGPGVPEIALDRALRRLPADELAAFVRDASAGLGVDGDALFAYSLDRLLEGLAVRLAPPRPRPGRSER